MIKFLTLSMRFPFFQLLFRINRFQVSHEERLCAVESQNIYCNVEMCLIRRGCCMILLLYFLNLNEDMKSKSIAKCCCWFFKAFWLPNKWNKYMMLFKLRDNVITLQINYLLKNINTLHLINMTLYIFYLKK